MKQPRSPETVRFGARSGPAHVTPEFSLRVSQAAGGFRASCERGPCGSCSRKSPLSSASGLSPLPRRCWATWLRTGASSIHAAGVSC
jgi:hypothetical protein